MCYQQDVSICLILVYCQFFLDNVEREVCIYKCQEINLDFQVIFLCFSIKTCGWIHLLHKHKYGNTVSWAINTFHGNIDIITHRNFALVVYFASPRTVGSIYGLHDSPVIFIITRKSHLYLVRRFFFKIYYFYFSRLHFGFKANIQQFISAFLSYTQTGFTFRCGERSVSILSRFECSGSG